ncbi:MAG: YggS family pyridoxal phosphate-dependent enzyme [Nitrospinota bacterium]
MTGSSYPDSLLKRISENLRGIEARIGEACERAGRNRDDITIVAATKNAGPEAIRAAIDCGIKVAGESRFQQAIPKIESIGGAVEWHFIGHIQKNKVKFLTDIFSLVHSVDSIELAEAINRRAGIQGRKVRILLQVNIGEETSKYGVPPDKAADVAEKIAALPFISLEGLMAIPPQVANAQESRKYLRKMIKIKNDIESMKLKNVSMKYLSFGMSGDYEVAVEEGATHVRIGTAIFGKRDYAK